MSSSFQLVAVAFLRSTGGAVRVLLAVDRDGEQLFDGEPALIVEHRAGRPAADLVVDGADRIDPAAFELVAAAVAEELVQLLDSAHDDFGQLDGERLLGRSVSFDAAADSFEMRDT